VIDVILSRRAERRWRLLAQFALIELAEAAHATWSDVAEGVGFEAAGTRTLDEVRGIPGSSERVQAVRRQVDSHLRRTWRSGGS
jgi:hypothetical protein